ncbi:MAG: hypothetical protein GTN40_00205 [Candidatus Aenigmarchaeota archaeon]|nr:hypothetical protein [Candidatus Aenigmarchaeota archaeon]
MVIYTKFNHARRKAFRLVTTIEKEGDTFYLYKKSISKKSDRFLLSLIDKYKRLNKYKLPFKVIEPTQTKKGIRFDYLEGKSFDGLLFESILTGNKESIKKVFLDYKDLVSKIPLSNFFATKEFEKYFGKTGKTKEECICIGCIDLILENIFIGKNRDFMLIDYEWTFSSPVPFKYILFRSVTNAYCKYSSYNIGKILPVKEIFDMFNISPKEEKQFLRYEYKFQSFANIDEAMVDFKLYLKNYKQLGKNNTVTFFDQKQQEITMLIKKVEQKDETIRLLNKTLLERNNEIVLMRSSRAWKIRNIVVRIKRKILT